MKLRNMLGLFLLTVSPFAISNDSFETELANRIISVSGGVQSIEDQALSTDDGVVRGFVAVEGNVSTSGLKQLLPFTLEVNTEGDVKGRIALGRYGSELNHIEFVAYDKDRLNSGESLETLDFIKVKGKQNLISGGGYYLALTGEASVGGESYKDRDGVELGGNVIDYSTSNEELLVVDEENIKIDMNLGMEVGYINGNNTFVMGTGYGGVRNKGTSELNRSGYTGKASYTYDFASGKKIEVFYEYDGTSTDFQNPETGEVIDMTKPFRNTHNAAVKVRF